MSTPGRVAQWIRGAVDRRATPCDTFDHRAKLAAADCPVLVMHALGDHLVDPEHARQLAKWAGERATLVLFPRGDHNSIHAYNGPEIRRHLLEFVRAVASEAVG